MRLLFILEGQRGSEVPGPVMSKVFELLERRGLEIESLKAEEVIMQTDLVKPTHDLYLLKSDTELSLSIAGILHSQGAQILNPYQSCITVRDKIVASRLLSAAGIPTPNSWITGNLNLLSSLVKKRPLIIKPYRGFHGTGVHIVFTPKDLEKVIQQEATVFVQDYVESNSEDLKVYVIGEEVFATRKPFSSDSFTKAGQLSPVSKEVRDIALRCGKVFGLGLYGLDIIESSCGPVVVDVNYFPGYKGIPTAASLLADYIEKYANEDVKLDLPTYRSSNPFLRQRS